MVVQHIRGAEKEIVLLLPIVMKGRSKGNVFKTANETYPVRDNSYEFSY